MPFLRPNKQRQSTEGIPTSLKCEAIRSRVAKGKGSKEAHSIYLSTVAGLGFKVCEVNELTQEEAFLLAARHVQTELGRAPSLQQARVDSKAGHVQRKLTMWLPRREPADHSARGRVDDRSLVAEVAG